MIQAKCNVQKIGLLSIRLLLQIKGVGFIYLFIDLYSQIQRFDCYIVHF